MGIALILGLAVGLAKPVQAETYTVNQMNAITIGNNDLGEESDAVPGNGIAEGDIGTGRTSLRAAIEEANQLPGHDTIRVPSGSVLLSRMALPPLTDPAGVTIIPTGETNFTLDGSTAAARLEAFVALMITDFDDLDGDDDERLTFGESLGLNFDPDQIINHRGGLFRRDFDYIDTNGDGLVSLEELEDYVPGENGLVIASPNNVIMGLTIINFPMNGIHLTSLEIDGEMSVADGNIIQGCKIGTSGAGDNGNLEHGILIDGEAKNNTIGGVTEAARNIISGNGTGETVENEFQFLVPLHFGNGIHITGPDATGNKIYGNYIGTDETGLIAVANAFSGIELRNGANGNFIGGSAAGQGNNIGGNGDPSDGCPDNCGNSGGYSYGEGIHVVGLETINNVIQGNLVGIGADDASVPNRASGIVVRGTGYNQIGGQAAGAGNRISGHAGSIFSNVGIWLIDTTSVVVESNIVVGNDLGLGLEDTIACIVGTPDAGNVFSASTSGVSISDGRDLIFQSNFIGTDADNNDLGSYHSGMYITGSLSNMLIGGNESDEANVFSGNRNDGIVAYNTTPLDGPTTPAVFIQGNFIGTNGTGTAALPNDVVGILLDLGAANVQIGGAGAGEGNVISGNGLDGIRIARSPNGLGAANNITILGNKIGTNATGSSFIPNSSSGVSIFEGGNVIEIGGIGVDEGNVIAGNGEYGVRIKGGSLEATNQNSIRGNSIYANGDAGIRLEDDSNDDMPAPTITLIGPVRGTSQANAIVDLYADGAGQGRFYIASGVADGAGNFTIFDDISGLSVSNLTATATNADGSTSEFSEPFPIVPPSIVDQPAGVVVVEGEPFTLSTVAAGSNPLLYQWQFLPADEGEFQNVINSGIFNGATTPTLNNTGARLADDGPYQCVVTNAVDTITTAVVIVDVVPANTDTAEVSTLLDTLDGDTTSPAHLISDPGTDGAISLREAIIAANNRAGADTISFSVGGTIALGSGLPSLNDVAGGTTIDGGGTIVLDGTALGGSIVGLQLASADNVLNGLTLVNFPGNGVGITGANASGNVITGCLIGTDGTSPQPNGGHGVEITGGASNNTVGGAEASSRNVLSGNEGSGVNITGPDTVDNTVIGNYIGVSESGLAAIANDESGVSILDGSNGNVIGGALEGEGNVVSANNASGVLLSGSGTTANVVSGNVIGLNATVDGGLGNVENGVSILDGATANIIGGDAVEAGNVIGGNARAAVQVEGALTVENTIRFNAITGNFGTGIELLDGGNTELVAPAITGLGSIDGTALPGTTVDLYASSDGQGETYLATATADGEGNFTSPVAVEALVGLYITATATDGAGNTSAFSERFFVDLEPPVITLLGDPFMTVQCGAVFVDPGATAEDDVDGNITSRIVEQITFGDTELVPAVNTRVLGTYIILYEVSDEAGQAAISFSRTVEVVDTTAPVITLNGAATLTLECGAPYVEAGATAIDGCDGNVDVTIIGTVDTTTPDDYPILYRAVDAEGNEAIALTRVVTVADTTLPVITVLGSLSVTLECGVPYLDAGATVTDSCDAGVTLETDNPVEPGNPGVYTVLYDATDASGNAAGQAFRTVTVVDTTAPEITLLGAADLTVECGVPYNEPGASVTDSCESGLDFFVTGTVNTSAPGNYTLVYSASDSAGNVADTVTRIVRVADNAIPVISLNGAATVNVACGGTYSELGATATDSCEGDLSEAIVISGSVNTAVAGSYTINYDVSDSVGNRATRRTRTVVVAVCPAPCEEQCAGDPDNAIDEDGDGISACVESCLGTSDSLTDSDSDGVPDNTEIDNGTDPVVPDSELDLDGDGLTQLEEFIFDSDALDPNSPSISFFVSPGGADASSGGGTDSPWATIGYAIAQSGASLVNPVRIILADGNYPEDVTLIPGVTLVGVVGALPRIEGTVFGADNSGLVNIEIAAFTGDDVMLVMDDVAMTLENVVFRGSAARPAAGILADGGKSAGSTIDGCLFVSLSIGIDVGGALPVIRRCTFEDTTIAGVFVRDTASIGTGASLGDVDDPSTGSNLFSGITQGRAIINELDETLLAQQNDWGTTDLDAILSTMVSGRVTVDPVLAPGSAANTASLYVTVWRAENQSRIGSAQVTATAADGASVTVEENLNGVYSLPILRAGAYVIEVSATGFEAQTLSVGLSAGELGSRIVALQVPQSKEGGPSCHGGAEGTAGFGLSDLVVVALLLGGLLVGTRVSRAHRPGA